MCVYVCTQTHTYAHVYTCRNPNIFHCKEQNGNLPINQGAYGNIVVVTLPASSWRAPGECARRCVGPFYSPPG